MAHSHATTVIGLGGMGQNMVARMHAHPGFEVVRAWDPDSGARQRALERFPHLQIAETAVEAIEDPVTEVVYIASPPRSHSDHAIAALNAGKAVYCEKPLGVDVADSRALVDHAQHLGLPNIVNFSLASTGATSAVEAWLASGGPGQVAGVDIRVHFSQWPRTWQMGATDWLSHRAEGGFTREVISHWVYLTQRLFGPLTVDDASVRLGDDDVAETHLHAQLRSGELPVSIAGSVGGVGPELVEYTIWGAASSCRVTAWHRFWVSDGGDFQLRYPGEEIARPGDIDNRRQLANAAAAIAGEPHTMPSFADALAVQSVIEAMLA